MGRAKQVLVGLMVLAVVGTFVRGGGTFATFNASTSNPSNITTGVLLLGDKVANGSSVAECFSSGATISAANAAACTSVWNVAGPNKPNDAFIAHLAIRNPGNLNASILQLYAAVGACDTAPGYLDAVSGTTFKGAPLSAGKDAPSLNLATDEQMYAAMLSGPESMPIFSDNQLTPAEKREIINYVQTLKASKDPGGNGIDRIGPVSEALVFWIAGVGAVLAAILWIGAKSE